MSRWTSISRTPDGFVLETKNNGEFESLSHCDDFYVEYSEEAEVMKTTIQTFKNGKWEDSIKTDCAYYENADKDHNIMRHSKECYTDRTTKNEAVKLLQESQEFQELFSKWNKLANKITYLEMTPANFRELAVMSKELAEMLDGRKQSFRKCAKYLNAQCDPRYCDVCSECTIFERVIE